eukprot:CAMPEP_0182915370 /NCGR_PEP_ID=MMETSP0105_2-20130417/288_1 /TAXON_ID=81532 ORGANISM="Acanthoeca-like sp., Strain 10tr" /NCGR_SAMPLE_ID=MMETSP0105_2 /ASSEMBLY_ACC=CAM_ASM_000205 /LENGTH=116 /DNA_ID=CAMNT_0025052229 /DNA_START=26 /DNA_END=376 /DNA_ORIENTATION=+
MSGAVARSVLGSTPATARQRAIGLYRAWYRSVPAICENFTLPFGVTAGRRRLRELFERNRDVKDVRVIDMLVVKGKLELDETLLGFKQTTHVMRFFDDPTGPKEKKDFLTDFLDNK